MTEGAPKPSQKSNVELSNTRRIAETPQFSNLRRIGETPVSKVKIVWKNGNGIGSTLEIMTPFDEPIGSLKFASNKKWVVVNYKDIHGGEKLDWNTYFLKAVELANKEYPEG